jgi:hypothetical protein
MNMKNNSHFVMALLLSLLFVVAGGLLAQSSGGQPAGSAEAKPSGASQLPRRLDKLQDRLDRMKRELATIREQLKNSGSPPADGTPAAQEAQTARRLDALQGALDRANEELASLRQHTKSAVASSLSSPSEPDALTREATHPAVGAIIQMRGTNVIVMELTSERRQFTLGENAFCVQFRDGRSFDAVDASDVYVDFTKSVGRVQVLRAVARLNRTEVGRFCGQVSLVMSGPWIMTTKLGSSSSKGQAVLVVPVE